MRKIEDKEILSMSSTKIYECNESIDIFLNSGDVMRFVKKRRIDFFSE